MIIVFFFSTVLFSCLPFLHCATDHSTSISICPESFSCPNSAPFKYPFYNATHTKCGLIKVHCTSNGTKMQLGRHSYDIVANYASDSSVLVVDRTFERLVNDKSKTCEALMYNFTSPSPLLYAISFQPFTTFYKCTNNPSYAPLMDSYFNKLDYNRYNRCEGHSFYYKYSFKKTTVQSDLPPTCQVIRLPLNFQEPNGSEFFHQENIFSHLDHVFSISFKLSTPCDECHKEAGRCHAFNGQFQCLDAKKGKPHRKLKSVLVIVGSVFLLVFFLFIVIIWHRYKTNPLSYFSSKDSTPYVEEGSLFHGVSVFSYTELEDATRNFDPSQELGNGGFGAVYYGKLQDGREVAVKRLYEHNYKRVQQFVNEVKLLTRLQHPNLVLLYGCTSRQSHELLLVYEYISNGTVADHLHGELANQSLLTWHLRMKIAIETARALVYLHASEIIHRDVKTSNILLDHNFSAKVADFGLSRLLPNDVSHVSTAPQGTPGYVDPQYHHRYQLTDKSDVYSFGVVLIELISSMVAVDLSRSKDEITLANLALNRIHRCALDQLVDPLLGSNADAEIMRMITSVAELAFRCLQFDSEMRPTMNEVLDVLGDIQAAVKVGDDDNVRGLENNHKKVLLKDFLSSPVSVTGEWHSHSTGSTTLIDTQ